MSWPDEEEELVSVTKDGRSKYRERNSVQRTVGSNKLLALFPLRARYYGSVCQTFI